MRKIFIAVLILILSLTSETFSAEIPRANIDEAERFYKNAYIHFMRRNYWEAQNYLDRAIRENTYMVDYYLLLALNLHRMGYLDEAENAMRSYLEVRPMDITARYILRNMQELDDIVRTVAGTAPIPVSWRYAESNVQSEWHTGFTRPFSIRGLGKVRSLGETVCIPDQLGNKLYTRIPSPSFRNMSVITEVNIPSPVISIPIGNGTFTVFTENGDVYLLPSATSTSADYLYTLPSPVVSDAEIIAEDFFAVADPAERCIALVNTSGARLNVRYWRPPLRDSDFLFEPVAVENYAEWLAVADRMNDRIYMINVSDLSYFTIPNVPKPRDLIFSLTGELFVLTDEGKIWNFILDFGTRTYANRYNGAMYSDRKNSWSFFMSPEGNINWLDMSASRIYRAVMMPDRDDMPAFMSIYNPSIITDDEGRESFRFSATVMSPFMNYARNSRITAQSVWNDRTMRCVTQWVREGVRPSSLIFGRGLRRSGREKIPGDVRVYEVSSIADIIDFLGGMWSMVNNDSEGVRRIFVESRTAGADSNGELLRLLKFCMMNGIELSIYGRGVTGLGLKRSASMTGGKEIYSFLSPLSYSDTPMLNSTMPVQNTKMDILMPLPADLSTSGYSGGSMLGIYMWLGNIQLGAWAPMNPEMFGTYSGR
ncbi:MAG: hypothetical protein IJR27_06530 [Synergistaceae bacterium]|nr:hypothetical protein [Synergistaceae bacterium]